MFIPILQSLAATLNGKKADAGPWIDILTSRDPEHLDKGAAGKRLSLIRSCFCFTPLTVFVCYSVDGTGAGVWTDGGSDSGEKVYRRLSTGFESSG